jgi:hypothetical protein
MTLAAGINTNEERQLTVIGQRSTINDQRSSVIVHPISIPISTNPENFNILLNHLIRINDHGTSRFMVHGFRFTFTFDVSPFTFHVSPFTPIHGRKK